MTGGFVDAARSRVTVGAWAEQWLAGQVQLKPSSRERYASILRTHIEPRWGRTELGQVTHAEIQAWVSTLSAKLSAATVAKVHRVLSLVLDSAVEDNRIARNPAKGIRLPRVRKREHVYLTHDEVAALAEAVSPSPTERARARRMPTVKLPASTAWSCTSSPTPASAGARWPPCA